METPENTKITKGEEIIASYHPEWSNWDGWNVGIYRLPQGIIEGSLFLTNRRVIFCTPAIDERDQYSSVLSQEEYNFEFNLDKTGKLEDEWEFGNNVSFRFRKKWFVGDLVDINIVPVPSISVKVPSAREIVHYLEGTFIKERKKSLERKANELFDVYSIGAQTDTDALLEAATNYKLLGMKEKFGECITKLALKCERLQDFDSAIDYYKIINSEEDVIRLRKQKSSKVRVDQTVVHGDYVDDRDTIVKDSVISKSSIGAGGDDKFTKLKELKEMLSEDLIDKEEFKEMKKEIMGK
jgi:hypothetical protein